MDPYTLSKSKRFRRKNKFAHKNEERWYTQRLRKYVEPIKFSGVREYRKSIVYDMKTGDVIKERHKVPRGAYINNDRVSNLPSIRYILNTFDHSNDKCHICVTFFCIHIQEQGAVAFAERRRDENSRISWLHKGIVQMIAALIKDGFCFPGYSYKKRF